MSFQMTVAEVKALGGAQMMACLDCLTAAAMADGTVTPKERERFKRIVLSVPWKAAGIEELIVQQRLDLTEKKLQGMSSAAQVVAFIKDCASKIPLAETRQSVLFLMAAIAHGDGEVNQAEKNVLGEYAAAFDLGVQTVQQIAAAAKQANL